MEQNNVMAGLALGGLQAGVNNMFAQHNAEVSYRRQKALMQIQNNMNNANQVGAAMNQVEGLRMAGFNPAMVAGAGSQPGATVSQGNADMPQTMPLDFGFAQLALIDAQKRNIDANTDKLEAETTNLGDTRENIKADTDLKVAQKLLSGANKDKVDEEVTNLRNINDAFAAENESLKSMGEVMANKWKSSDWYKKLAPDTKATVDAIADGSLPLTVGAVRALDKVIKAQKDLSDADRSIVDNAFANAVTESMFKDSKVMSALAKMPEAEYENVKARTFQAVQDALFTKLNKDWTQDKYDVYHKQDPDYLYAEYQKNPTVENLVKWLSGTVNDKMNKAYDTGTKAVPAYIGGRAVGKGMQGDPKIHVNDKPDHGSKTFYKGGLGDWNQGYGVESMRK